MPAAAASAAAAAAYFTPDQRQPLACKDTQRLCFFARDSTSPVPFDPPAGVSRRPPPMQKSKHVAHRGSSSSSDEDGADRCKEELSTFTDADAHSIVFDAGGKSITIAQVRARPLRCVAHPERSLRHSV